MSDYINREDVIETVYKLREHFKCWDRDDDIAIKNALNAIPTADVVEVVRCKDCKHNYRRTTWNHGERDNPACKYTNYVRDNDFFCSYGERADT